MEYTNFEEIAKLVVRAQQGDTSAFSIIYSEYVQKIYFLCLELLRNPQDAQDATQEIFLNAFEKINTLANPMMFDKWIFVSATRKCADICKRKTPQLFSEFDDSQITDVTEDYDTSLSSIQEEKLIEKETADRLNQFIYSLPYKLRSAVLCYYFANMSIAEIAYAEGVSESVIQNRLFQARKKLKEKIKMYGNDTELNSAMLFLPLILTGCCKNTFIPISMLSAWTAGAATTATVGATAGATTLGATAVGTTSTVATTATVAGAAAVKTGILASVGAKIAVIAASTVLVAGGTVGTIAVVNHNNSAKNQPTTNSSVVSDVNDAGGTTDFSNVSYIKEDGTADIGKILKEGVTLNGKKISLPCTVKELGDEWYIDESQGKIKTKSEVDAQINQMAQYDPEVSETVMNHYKYPEGRISNGSISMSVTFVELSDTGYDDIPICGITANSTEMDICNLVSNGNAAEDMRKMFGEPQSIFGGSTNGKPAQTFQYSDPVLTAQLSRIQATITDDGKTITYFSIMHLPEEYR